VRFHISADGMRMPSPIQRRRNDVAYLRALPTRRGLLAPDGLRMLLKAIRCLAWVYPSESWP